MNLEEYNKKMDKYAKKLREEYSEELCEEISDFQQKFMTKVLEEQEGKIDSDAKQVIYDLLHYAVHCSESGSSIEYVDTKELADEIDDIIWDEIGDYLLDYQVYEEGGLWAIDCMFGGFYVPDWDGWFED